MILGTGEADRTNPDASHEAAAVCAKDAGWRNSHNWGGLSNLGHLNPETKLLRYRVTGTHWETGNATIDPERRHQNARLRFGGANVF